MSKNKRAIILILAIVAVFAVWTIKHLLQPSTGVEPDVDIMTSVRAQIEHLQQLEENDPDNPEILTALGNIYFDAGMSEQAVEYYDRVLAIEPENVDVLVDKATMFRAMGRAPEAIQILEQVVARLPHHEQALFNMGVIYSVDLLDTASAIRAWQSFLEINPHAAHADAVRQQVEQMERESGAR
jgi:tetratricopeptide (TPR) repeat protein